MMYLPILDTLKQTRYTYLAQLDKRPNIRLFWLCDLLYLGTPYTAGWGWIWLTNIRQPKLSQELADLHTASEFIARFNADKKI